HAGLGGGERASGPLVCACGSLLGAAGTGDALRHSRPCPGDVEDRAAGSEGRRDGLAPAPSSAAATPPTRAPDRAPPGGPRARSPRDARTHSAPAPRMAGGTLRG